MFRQTEFSVEEMISALDGKGRGHAAELPTCLLMNELGVEAQHGSRIAEAYLAKMLLGHLGDMGRFLALCYLMGAQINQETQEVLDRVISDPDPAVQEVVARAAAAVGG